MAGDPPDIIISPKLSDIGLLELYRADEAIKEGSMCVQRMVSEIEYVLGKVWNFADLLFGNAPDLRWSGN